MLKRESMAKKKKERRLKRERGLSNRKKVGLGWDSICKARRTGFKPRDSTEAKAHQIEEKEEISGLEKMLKGK